MAEIASSTTASNNSASNATPPANANNATASFDTTMLYDRQTQLHQLKQAYRRRLGTSEEGPRFAELTLLNGPAGSGKTSLANAFGHQHVHTTPSTSGSSSTHLYETGRCIFISGKFQLRHQHAAAATATAATCTTAGPLVEAFDQFTNIILAEGLEAAQTMKEVIQAVVGASEISLVLDLIPPLRRLFNVGGAGHHGHEESTADESERSCFTTTTASSSSNNDNFAAAMTTRAVDGENRRIVVVLRRLLRAICCGGKSRRRLILFLDDLQWANKLSLDLIRALVSPSIDNHQGLMVLGACRGGEVSPHNGLSVLLRNLEDQGTKINEIAVPNLSVDALSRMIQDRTGRSREECTQISRETYSHHGGNPFFVKQYFAQDDRIVDDQPVEGASDGTPSDLEDGFGEVPNDQVDTDEEDDDENDDNDDGYNTTSNDNSNSNSNTCLPNLVERMRCLTQDVQRVLMAAACIGGEIREMFLCWSLPGNMESIRQALRVGVEEDILVYDFASKVGSWRHDIFQEAAMLLIPSEEKASFCLSLGQSLKTNGKDMEHSPNYLPIVINLMVRGKSKIKDQAENDEVAHLCLCVSKIMTKSSAFSEAIIYVDHGLQMLSSTHWEDQYDLSLGLHNAGAELAYCNGDHAKVDHLAGELKKNAHEFEECIQVDITLILSLSSRSLNKEAGALGVNTLLQLGETFPSKIGRVGALKYLKKAKRALRGKSDDDILKLPRIRDTRVLAIMSLLHVLYPIALTSHIEITPMMSSRLVCLSLQYGLCSYSSVGFAFYGSSLARMGDVTEGWRFGELSIKIIAKHPTKELMARALMRVGLNLRYYKEPFRLTVATLSEAQRLGMLTGDIETAMYSAASECGVRLFIGDALDTVVKATQSFLNLSIDYGQQSVGFLGRPILQMCLNLQGKAAGNPLVLTGEAMNEKSLTQQAEKDHNTGLLTCTLFIKYMLATYLNELAYAASLSARLRELMANKQPMVPLLWTFHLFFEGLVAIALANAYQKSSLARNRELRTARQRLKSTRKAATYCPENMMNKVHLLEADLAACHGNYDKAESEYRQSIVFAEHEGFLSEQALACEKLARMLRDRCGKDTEAESYFIQSRALYKKYGATILVDRITKEIETCHELEEAREHSSPLTENISSRSFFPTRTGYLVPVLSECDVQLGSVISRTSSS